MGLMRLFDKQFKEIDGEVILNRMDLLALTRRVFASLSPMPEAALERTSKRFITEIDINQNGSVSLSELRTQVHINLTQKYKQFT